MDYRNNPNIYFICSQIDLLTINDKVTGQSVITSYVENILKEDYNIFLKIHSINNGKKFKTISNLIEHILEILLCYKKVKFAYFVISRSKFGFIRDSLLIIACFLKKIKVITHIHGSDIIHTRNFSKIHNFLFYLLKNTLNIVPSKTLKEELSELKINSIFLSNFSTLFYLNKNKKHYFHNKKKDITILWNSNIIYTKGFFHISEALLKVYKNGFKNFTFQILGRIIADENIDLWTYIEKIQNYKFVNYIGPVDNNKSYQFLLKSDIVALPSFYKTECQPLALIDAMTANKHIIISDNKYLLELTKGYKCTIFNLPLSINDMSDNIEKLLIAMFKKKFTVSQNYNSSKFSHYMFKDNIKRIFENV